MNEGGGGRWRGGHPCDVMSTPRLAAATDVDLFFLV